MSTNREASSFLIWNTKYSRTRTQIKANSDKLLPSSNYFPFIRRGNHKSDRRRRCFAMSNLHSNMWILLWRAFDRPPIATTWRRLIRTARDFKCLVQGIIGSCITANTRSVTRSTGKRSTPCALGAPARDAQKNRSFKLQIRIGNQNLNTLFAGRSTIDRFLRRVVTYESFKFNYRMRDR